MSTAVPQPNPSMDAVVPESVAAYLILNYPMGGRSFRQNGAQHRFGYRTPATSDFDLEGKGIGRDPAQEMERAIRYRLARVLHESDAPVFHLSGGVDSSLLCTIAKSMSHRTIDTVVATYETRQEDCQYGLAVADHLGTKNQLLLLRTDDFETRTRAMVAHCERPIMAMGIVTFDIMAQNLAEQGFKTAVTGVGADHQFVGYKTLSVTSGPPSSPRALMSRIRQVSATDIAAFCTSRLQRLIEAVSEQCAAGFLASGLSPETVRDFYEDNFLPEHLLWTHYAHERHDLNVEHPFLDDNVQRLCAQSARQTDRSSDPRSKRLLIDLLRDYGSPASVRRSVAQMIPPDAVLAASWNATMLDVLSRRESPIPGIRYEAFIDAMSSQPVTRSRQRLLWTLYNLELFLSELNLSLTEADFA